MAAVSDSSPIIFYAVIGRLELLQQLYGEMLVPPAVWREIAEQGAERPGTAQVREAHWIRQRTPPHHNVIFPPLEPLDRGEAEAIALAMASTPRMTLILDDLPARRVAQDAGLEIIGSGGVLVLAKRKRLITSVAPILADLRSAGLYLSDAVVETFLQLADEK